MPSVPLSTSHAAFSPSLVSAGGEVPRSSQPVGRGSEREQVLQGAQRADNGLAFR